MDNMSRPRFSCYVSVTKPSCTKFENSISGEIGIPQTNKKYISILHRLDFFKKCVSISVCFFVSLFYLGFKSVSTEKGGRAKAVLKVLVLVCDVGMCCAHLAGQGLALIPEPLCRGAPDC